MRGFPRDFQVIPSVFPRDSLSGEGTNEDVGLLQASKTGRIPRDPKKGVDRLA